MPGPAQSNRGPAFGPFEVDLSAWEIRKHGLRIRLQEKPFQILLRLLEKQGTVVTREELHDLLWPGNHFVEFDHNLNNAVNKLREALNDSTDEPRYIETIPRRGYRFLAEVSWNGDARAAAEALAEPAAEPRPQEAERTRARWIWAASAGLAVVAFASIFFFRNFLPFSKRNLDFRARDWVLITNFENRTGEKLLDGTLEFALERELLNSQFVNVVPRERIEDALRLMRKPVETRIDAALGREICLRDGGIRALVTGRVEKLGTTYVLSAQVMDPARGVSVASLSEEDPAETQLAAVVRRLSNRVRQTLGEKARLIQLSEQRLERVSTPSLYALQLYTQADRLISRGKSGLAAELLERALAEDPDFASGHVLLGHAYSNEGNSQKGAPHFRRAYELADSTPDRERFFIQASYFENVLGAHQKAFEAYEALLRLYPDHFWGLNNFLMLCQRMGRDEEANETLVRLGELRPNDIKTNAEAAFYLATYRGSPALAAPFLERVRAVKLDEGAPWWLLQSAYWARLFPATQDWLRDDVAGAKAELAGVEKATAWRDTVMYPFDVGTLHLILGQLKEAGAAFETISDPAWRNHALVQLAFARGDERALREHLEYYRTHAEPSPLMTAMLVHGGFLQDAEKMARSLEQGGSPWSAAASGQVALARGERAKGIRLVEKEVNRPGPVRHPVSFLAAESLARRYQQDGKLELALAVLERMSRDRAKVCGPSAGAGYGYYWMRTQLQLAQLYRKLGRIPDAQKVEAQLLKLLAYADADHPMLRELQRLQVVDGPKPQK